MAEYIDRVEYCEKHCRCSNEYCDRQSCQIWKAPAADVAPVRHGRWVLVNKAYDKYKCSNCGALDYITIGQKYCIYCGAKMDGGDSDADD